MKIVDRKTFLQLPRGTVYSHYQPHIFDGLYIKTSSPEDGWGNDWVLVQLIDGFIKDVDDNFLDESKYNHFEFDLDRTVRDGMYDDKQLFAVYEKQDILSLVEKLTFSLSERND